MVRRVRIWGRDVIILEELPYAIVWIYEDELEAKVPTIKGDSEDKTGFGKYRKELKQMGFDV